MSLPAPLAGFLAAVFLAAAALCAVSLWRRRGRHEGVAAAAEANHVVMGLGMAVMVLPATMGAVPPVGGAVAFGVVGGAWAVRLVVLRRQDRSLGAPVGGGRCGAHPTHLLLSNAAMVVMYVAMIPTGGSTAGMADMPGMDMSAHAGPPPLALSALGAALAVYLLVHSAITVGVVVRSSVGTVAADVGPGAAGAAARLGRAVDSSAVQLGCQAVTGIGMALMLLVH
ncbi:hypothetical protein Acsp06_46710 [Actinomycetospora sp. NBRC 106375]|uniref:DUF5134 domain-containing protein n=1 Tax=Actinomycetospora sp. NBRC 106375 TaxID=3032207 RepID=UPI0024A31612|nr:DUF5134 domain-containing protein [Actinomycetospora sp. NBRC 106375]GLZ48486.1 hypothetical protein Acsp06_46710 [Actinomycetospora sp. NBRC 106375]